jgi:hypothetical protein
MFKATSIFKVTHHLEEFTDKFFFANPHIRVLRDRVID